MKKNTSKKNTHDLRYGGAMCDNKERKALLASIDKSLKSGNWQQGEQGALMEKECAEALGLKYAVLTTSGSCAGILALSALELPKGSEVIIPAVTFPTIFNIIVQQGYVPVVVDCKVGSYTFDVKEVEAAITPKTGAIIAVHPVGNPVDMPALMRMVKKQKHKIYVLEDGCDTWGGSINGKKIGSFGDISFTSFHAAHIVSMGVGGGVFTSDKELASRVRQYRDWGRQANTTKPHTCPTLPADYNPRFVYEKIGYNFQILELQAAMGRVQLKKAGKIKKARQKNFDYLVKHLSRHEDLIMPRVVKNADVCWFALPLTTVGDRRSLVKHLEKHGIETRSMFAGNILAHPAYANVKAKAFRVDEANIILQQSFWITVHPRLTKSDLDYIISVFDKYYAETA